jgi:hypothetical protein
MWEDIFEVYLNRLVVVKVRTEHIYGAKKQGTGLGRRLGYSILTFPTSANGSLSRLLINHLLIEAYFRLLS